MAFKTSIPFGGGKQEAYFVNDGIVSKAELGYDVAPFPTWEGTENLVLRLELEKEGLRWPQQITVYGSYESEEVEKEVTKGRGKTKTTEVVKTTRITGMGSAFRVTDLLREICESGQIDIEMEINEDGEIVVNGEAMVPEEPGAMIPLPQLVDKDQPIKIFSIRYKAKRGKGATGYNTHRRVMTYRAGEDDNAVIERLKYDFRKQVRGGWIKDYLGEVIDEPSSNGVAEEEGKEKVPF